MLNLWKYFKTKMTKIGPIERILHCVKIDKLKKMTLYNNRDRVVGCSEFELWFKKNKKL